MLISAEGIEPKFSTLIPIYKEHTGTLALDGNHQTYFSSARNTKRGETIDLKFDKSIKGKTVTVYSGQASGKDLIHNARLQSSTDGVRWKTLSNFRQGKAQGVVSNEAKHLRIEFYADAWSWIAIREIKIDNQPPTLKTVKKSIRVDGVSHELKITVDSEGVEDLAKVIDDLIERYFIEWPLIAKLIDAPIAKTPKHLYLTFEKSMGHPAHVTGTTMVISAKHIREYTDDTYGVFTHELTHFVQNYAGKAPTWLGEGIADYARFKLNKDSIWARQNLRHQNRKNPLGSYWNSTAFLLWLEDEYKKPVAALLSRACNDGTYSDATWKEITTKSLEELTQQYQQPTKK